MMLNWEHMAYNSGRKNSLLVRFDKPGFLAHEPRQCILGSTSTSLVLDIWNIGTVFTLLAS